MGDSRNPYDNGDEFYDNDSDFEFDLSSDKDHLHLLEMLQKEEEVKNAGSLELKKIIDPSSSNVSPTSFAAVVGIIKDTRDRYMPLAPWRENRIITGKEGKHINEESVSLLSHYELSMGIGLDSLSVLYKQLTGELLTKLYDDYQKEKKDKDEIYFDGWLKKYIASIEYHNPHDHHLEKEIKDILDLFNQYKHDIHQHPSEEVPFKQWLKNNHFTKEQAEQISLRLFKYYYYSDEFKLTFLPREKLKDYEARVLDDGLLYIKMTHPHKLYDQKDLDKIKIYKHEAWIPLHSQDKELIYNLVKFPNEHEQLYVARPKPGKFHHHSFTRGEYVIDAGKIAATQGKDISVKNESGHFKTSPERFNEGILAYLHKSKYVTKITYVKRGKDNETVSDVKEIAEIQKNAAKKHIIKRFRLVKPYSPISSPRSSSVSPSSPSGSASPPLVDSSSLPSPSGSVSPPLVDSSSPSSITSNIRFSLFPPPPAESELTNPVLTKELELLFPEVKSWQQSKSENPEKNYVIGLWIGEEDSKAMKNEYNETFKNAGIDMRVQLVRREGQDYFKILNASIENIDRLKAGFSRAGKDKKAT